MFRSITVIALLASAAIAQPSNAAVVLYSDDFNNIAPPNTSLSDVQVNGLRKVRFVTINPLVIEILPGTADVFSSGVDGNVCAGGSGGCIDLYTVTGPSSFVFDIAGRANRTYSLSIDIGPTAAQRAGGTEGRPIAWGTQFPNLTNVTYGANGGNVAFSGALTPTVSQKFGRSYVINNVNPLSMRTDLPAGFSNPVPNTHLSNVIDAGFGFKTLVLTIKPDRDGPFSVELGGGFPSLGPSYKQDGLVFDNIKLTVGGVPEPSSWAMLITGFGLVGALARRRRVAAA